MNKKTNKKMSDIDPVTVFECDDFLFFVWSAWIASDAPSAFRSMCSLKLRRNSHRVRSMDYISSMYTFDCCLFDRKMA